MKNTMQDFFDFVRRNIFIILGGLCVVVIGFVYIFSRLQPSREILPQDIIYTPTTAYNVEVMPAAPIIDDVEVRTIIVHIVGEVQNPGVYELPYRSRVDDVLQMAGGGTVYADLSVINLAAFLRDAMQIRIPAFGEDLEYLIIEEVPAAQTTTAGGLVNINTASSAELQTLPRIGQVMAQRIIDFREAHGNFATVDELINISGIGEPTLNSLRELVTVGNTP